MFHLIARIHGMAKLKMSSAIFRLRQKGKFYTGGQVLARGSEILNDGLMSSNSVNINSLRARRDTEALGNRRYPFHSLIEVVH